MNPHLLDTPPLRPGCTGHWEHVPGRTVKSYLRHRRPCPHPDHQER